jgi:hypothetical protein
VTETDSKGLGDEATRSKIIIYIGDGPDAAPCPTGSPMEPDQQSMRNSVCNETYR